VKGGQEGKWEREGKKGVVTSFAPASKTWRRHWLITPVVVN